MIRLLANILRRFSRERDYNEVWDQDGSHPWPFDHDIQPPLHPTIFGGTKRQFDPDEPEDRFLRRYWPGEPTQPGPPPE